MQITTIGLDIAKNVFQVHGIDAAEKVVVKKQLRRNKLIEFFKNLPPCLIGMEACATAHYWARELTKLGHEVRLMPPKDVKAYLNRNKNDAADAAAICEAVRRPTMRVVRVKSAEQQGQLMQHRTRDLLMRQRTQLINALRGHLAEFGIVAAQGDAGLKELLAIVADDRDGRLPSDARACVIVLAAQLDAVQTMLRLLDKRIMKQHRANEAGRRLELFRGLGSSARARLRQRCRTRWFFVQGVISRLGSGWCRDRTRLAASRSSGRSPSRVTSICGAFSLSAPIRYCDVPRKIH